MPLSKVLSQFKGKLITLYLNPQELFGISNFLGKVLIFLFILYKRLTVKSILRLM